MDYQDLLRQNAQYPDQMTASERSVAYACGAEVDRLPTSISVREFSAPLYGYSVGDYRRDFLVKVAVYQAMNSDFGCEGISIGPNLKKIGEALGAKACYPENGVDYLTSQPLFDYKDFSRFEIPAPQTNTVLKAMLLDIKSYKQHFGQNFAVGTDIGGPFTTAMSIRPAEMILKDTIQQPDNLKLLLDFSVECELSWVKTAYELFGVSSVNIADPGASISLIGPRMFRELAAPPLQKLFDGCQKITGKIPNLHICGKTKPIWDDLANIGFTSFRVDNCEDLAELKSAVGTRMAISGNIPPVDVLLNGSIDDVINSARNCIAKCGDNPRGYTLAGGCQLPIGVSKANLLAMLYAARKYAPLARIGKYYLPEQFS